MELDTLLSIAIEIADALMRRTPRESFTVTSSPPTSS